jgi:hypothetical protein
LKEIAINFIITIVERVPSLVKKDKDKLKGIVIFLFQQMVNVDLVRYQLTKKSKRSGNALRKGLRTNLRMVKWRTMRSISGCKE